MGQRFSDISSASAGKKRGFCPGRVAGCAVSPLARRKSDRLLDAGYSSNRRANSRLQVAQVITNRPHAITSRLISVSPEAKVCAR
jgi:hypothetical protein